LRRAEAKHCASLYWLRPTEVVYQRTPAEKADEHGQERACSLQAIP